MSILDKMNWRVGEAKQRLSELLRESASEPQMVYSRDRLVAAVISAEEFEEFRAWREERRRGTLGRSFDEVREICREEAYAFDAGERGDRAGWITDGE